MSIKRSSRWFLAAAFFLFLTPAFAVPNAPDHGLGSGRGQGCNDRDRQQCSQQVPEGGSSPAYLLGVGAVCLGAMFLRIRSEKRRLA